MAAVMKNSVYDLMRAEWKKYLQATFFFGAIVNTTGDHIPATVNVSKVSTPYRTGSSQSQLESFQWCARRGLE
jgi:hypothetical protein